MNVIMPSFKKRLMVEQFQGNYLKNFPLPKFHKQTGPCFLDGILFFTEIYKIVIVIIIEISVALFIKISEHLHEQNSQIQANNK